MSFKVIGMICIVAGCGGCGFLMASQHRQRIRLMENMIAALAYMECELQYRGTPLPQLCRMTGQRSQGRVQKIFIMLADEMEAQISPDVPRCMASVLDRLGNVDKTLRGTAEELGANLGRFDMPGQLRGLENTRKECCEKLEMLTLNNDNRLRSYQTLGLCAGAALAILLV